jgi:HK97 family phage portal protein
MFDSLKSFFATTKSQTEGRGFYPMTDTAYAVKSLTRTDYLRLYQSWVYLCVSTIADSVSELEFVLKRGGKEVDDRQLAIVTPTFLRDTVAHMLLTGTAYWFMERMGKRVDSVQLMRSDMVWIDENPDGSLKSYRYDGGRSQMNVPKDEMLDFSLFNPIQTYPYTVKGVSPVAAVAIQAEMDVTASRWNWNFFKNGANAGAILSTDQMVSPENKNLIIRMWKEKFQGVNNSHNVAILDNGLKFSTASVNQKELDFVESRRFTRDEIMAIFKLPPAVVGITDNANRASAQVALETYYRVCVSPIANQIARTLTDTVFKGIGTFEFVNVVPQDVELMQRDLMVGAITVNEYRQARGYDKVSGGDSINGTEQTEPTPEKSAFRKTVETEIRKRVKGTPEYMAEFETRGQKKWESKVMRTNPFEYKFKQYVAFVFDEQKRDIVASLSESKSTKKVTVSKVNRTKWATLWTGLSGLYKEVMQSEGTAANAEIGISTVFQTGNVRTNKYVRDSVNRLAKEADDYTLEAVGRIIEEGNEAGLGANAIANNVSAKFEQYSRERAQTIARTEVVTAANDAELMAYKDSGVVAGREWYTSLDERVCDSCGPMHGRMVELEKPFFEKGDTFNGLKLDYRTVEGPALHPNCRCTTLAVLK